MPVRPRGEPAGDPAVREGRDGARPRLPVGAPLSPRTVLVARHALAGSNIAGTASGTPPGEGLVEAGIEQARGLGAALAKERIDAGVTSTFRRTQETLALTLAGRAVSTVIVPELDEIDFGSFDGGPLSEYRRWAASERPTTPAPGGGESRAAVAKRYARGLRRILELDAEVVLLVGHALFCRYTLDAASGLVPAARMAPVEHAVPYRVGVRELTVAADVLEGWSRAPRFRDPSGEGEERS